MDHALSDLASFVCSRQWQNDAVLLSQFLGFCFKNYNICGGLRRNVEECLILTVTEI
jgi:hypothetical protein